MRTQQSIPLAVTLVLLLCSAAAADPYRISFRAEVSAPDRPTLTFLAEEPLRALRLSLRPGRAEAGQPGAQSPETQPQSFAVPALRPGQSHTIRLGTGKPGRTLWTGALEFIAGGKAQRSEVRFETLVIPQVKIMHDPRLPSEHLSLDDHYIDFQASQPVERAEISVLGEDGSEIGSGEARFSSSTTGTGKPGAWLRVPWKQRPGATVLRLNLKVFDMGGFAHSVTLTPWMVTVPHEEVNFATASFEIPPADRPKLDEAAGRIAAIVERVKAHISPRLYVAGHTDTVGGDADNMTLSLQRARAIAGYLQRKGLAVPILYAGFGERVPKVATPDNTDEVRNRRADYVLALDPPRYSVAASWQRQ